MSSQPLDGSETATKQPENQNLHPECGNCRKRVTREYHRVLSDNEGFLRSCLHCTTKGTSGGERQ